MKKVVSGLALAMLLAQSVTPVVTLAHNDHSPNVLQVTSSTNSTNENLTENEWLRQIVVVSEDVNQEVAQEIVRQLEGYSNHLLQGLAINNAKIQIVETLAGLTVLPEGTDGAELNSYLTSNNGLYLKAKPSENNGSAHFALQQAALLMNQAIFNNIFSSSDYKSYYYADLESVSYNHLNQLDFIAESLGYFAYNDYSTTEVYKALYLRYYLYYLIADYEPKQVESSQQYLDKIIEFPTVPYDEIAAKAIIAKLELFDLKFLEALALNGAKLKLVNTLDDNTPTAKKNELIIEIGKDYTNDWSYDELLRQIVLWVDASLWYNTSQSLDFKYVYDYSYPNRNFGTDQELTQEEFFAEAVVLRLNKQLKNEGKMQPVYWYMYYLLRDFQSRTVDYNEEFEIDPITISAEENALFEELIPQVIEITAGATDYDIAEVERITDRLKRFGSEVFKGMIYNEIKIRLTTGPITNEPEMDYLADVTPRGWPEELTWADVPGAGGNPVFTRIGHSYMGMGHSTINLEHHETAHILDLYLFDYISLSDEWVALHEEEAVSLYGNDGYMAVYPEEYFAEASTFYFLSGHKRATLKRLAPKSYEFIHNLYSNYKAVDPFDLVVDAEKVSYIDKILIIDTDDEELKNHAITTLKRIDVKFLKGLAHYNIKYSLSKLGQFEQLEQITTVNPILNQVARDIDKHLLKNASTSAAFKATFDKEAPVVNEPKQPKSLFWSQPFISENANEFLAEAFAMYYHSGTTKYDLGSKAPDTWTFIEEINPTFATQPPTTGGGSGGSSTNPGDTPTVDKETVLENGTVVKERVQANGDKVIVMETVNGSKTETTITGAGEVVVTVNLSKQEVAQAGNQPVVLPIPKITVSTDIATAPIIKFTSLGDKDTTSVKVIIPIQNVTVSTVVMIVHEDGTTEVISNTKFNDGNLTFEAYPNVTYKVVDNSKIFEDVEDTSWYSRYVLYASAREWMNGINDAEFSPNRSITRAEFVTLLHRINNIGEVPSTDIEYSDVNSGAFYNDAVNWAKENGVMMGYGDGSFGVGQSITREDFTVVLWRSAGSTIVEDMPADFTDFDKVSSYAKQAMAWAVANGLLTGKGNGVLDPKGNATRAEATKLLMHFEESVMK